MSSALCETEIGQWEMDMRLPDDLHAQFEWRVHELAADFELLDVWRFPITSEADVPFEAFLSFLLSSERGLAGGSGLAGLLFRIRSVLGTWFGWDRDVVSRSIPGSADRSVRARLTAADRARDLGPFESGSGTPGPFAFVYRFEEEALLEISNATVHACLHLGRVPIEASERSAWAPQMAVYVRPRGVLGRVYMAIIGPFRHAIVYPALMRGVVEGWPAWLRNRQESRS